eukprot:SAG31_NODE_6510_length_1991_cov_2.016385_4_plen_147_part_00
MFRDIYLCARGVAVMSDRPVGARHVSEPVDLGGAVDAAAHREVPVNIGREASDITETSPRIFCGHTAAWPHVLLCTGQPAAAPEPPQQAEQVARHERVHPCQRPASSVVLCSPAPGVGPVCSDMEHGTAVLASSRAYSHLYSQPST